jgi:hypothetical protein
MLPEVEIARRTIFMDHVVYGEVRRLEGLSVRIRRGRKRFRVLPLDQIRGMAGIGFSTFATGVYFLWRGPALVYVGRSVCVGHRLEQHVSGNRKEFTHATYEPAASENLDRFERAYIKHYKPFYNVAGT